jgi:hypothetical protein
MRIRATPAAFRGGAVLVLALHDVVAAQTKQPTSHIIGLAPGLFEFHSGPWYDLHHMLYAQARTRLGIDSTRPAVVKSVRDTAGLGARSAADRDAWEAAVGYYERSLARRDATFDVGMIDIDMAIAGAENASTLRGSGLDTSLANVLERVAPIHRALWWPAHDSANRAWVREVLPLLRNEGAAVATGVSSAFGTHWADAPIRVDLAAYEKGGGAYTTIGPSHINMPSLDEGYRGTRSLEMLFHESMHTLDDSLGQALSRAASAKGKHVPRDIGHVLIFYTAGEVTRQRFPGHEPYAEHQGLWARVQTWADLLPLVRAQWQPWLDGRISFEQAISGLVEGFPAIR